MPPLSSMLLQREVATLREVDEALARQALYGGDLVTNLLEVARVGESQLLRVLAAFHGVQAWAPGPLPAPDPTAVALFPRDIAVEYAVVPLRLSPEVCDVVVTEPLAPAMLDDLKFSVGLRLVQFVAIPARVRLASSRTYDVPLDRRDLRVLARLEGLADPSPSEAPPPDTLGDPLPPQRFPEPAPVGVLVPEAVPDQVSEPVPEQVPVVPEPVPEQVPVVPEPVPEQVPFVPEPLPEQVPFVPEPVPEQVPFVPEPSRAPVPATTATAEVPSAPSRVPFSPASLALQAPIRARSARIRRKGPFTLAMAREALEEADSHGALLRVLFDFTRQYFEYSALFLVREDIAEGVDASGPGVDRERIRGIGVPLDLDGILRDARSRKLNVLAIPRTEGVDAALRQDLRRPMNHEVLVIPVAIRQRVVALLYGDDGADPVDMQAVGDVLALVPLVSAALERLILRKKLQQRESKPPSSAPGSRETLRGLRGLPGLAEVSPDTVPSTGFGSPGPLPSINAPFPVPFRPEEGTLGGPPRRITATLVSARITQETKPAPAPPRRTTASMGAVAVPPPAQPTEQATAPEPPAPEPRPEVAKALGVDLPADAPAPPQVDTERQARAPAAAEAPAVAPAARAETKPAASAVESGAPAPDVVVGEVEEADDMVMAVLDELQRSPEPQTVRDGVDMRESAAATHMISEGPRVPPKSAQPSDVGLPLVMVDVRGVASELLDALERDDLRDNETARIRDELVRLGDDAAAVLASRFPGPVLVTPDPTRPSLPSVAECGPLLMVASMLGRKAIVHIEPLVHAADSDVRFWAVLLLAELGGSIASRAVLSALFDDDQRVRIGARASMRAAAGRRAWVADVREKLRRTAENANESVTRRVAAIESLGALRERATVPWLLDLLESPEDELRAAAHDALQTVARKSLPASFEAWRAWWDDHVARDRIEWLIDALDEGDEPHASAAFDELDALAGEGFGYDAAQPEAERTAAVARFRSWWRGLGTRRNTDPPSSPK